MDKQIINLSANEQELVLDSGVFEYASNIVSYIEAVFDLGDNWDSFDSVRAVWTNGYSIISTVLDADGTCIVPMEVLNRKGCVKVNLVGSIVDDDVVTDRLTTFPVIAVKVTKNALIEGSETEEITASQFEQFVSDVQEYSQTAVSARNDAVDAQTAAETAQGLAEAAQTAAETAETNAATSAANAYTSETNAAASAASAYDDAERAEQAAAQSGYMFFYIDGNGDLIYQRTSNTQVDFYLSNGDLYVEATA